MAHKFKKRIIFFLGILLTGATGTFGNYIRTNYTKSESLLVSYARADTPPATTCDLTQWTQQQCDVYFSCDGCDGGCCSGGPSDSGTDGSGDAGACDGGGCACSGGCDA